MPLYDIHNIAALALLENTSGKMQIFLTVPKNSKPHEPLQKKKKMQKEGGQEN